MSVQSNHYVLWGIKFKYKDPEFLKLFNLKDWDEFAQKYDQLIKPYLDTAFSGIVSFGGLSILDDGMNGEYIIIGYILNKSDHSRDDLSDYTQPFKSQEEVETVFLDQFNMEVDIELIAITHYR